MKTYRIATLHDLLSVPAERREACMREILDGLLMHELVYGKEAKNAIFKSLSWTDDSDHSVQINDGVGKPVAKLSVAKQEVKT